MKMSDDLEGALRKYIVLLASEAYYDAHEVLEEAWHPMRLRKDPMANALKGLINAAVAFEHLKRNRPQAADRARRVMQSYERHKALAHDAAIFPSLFQEACARIERLKATYTEIFEGV